jgi:hypothetical protein
MKQALFMLVGRNARTSTQTRVTGNNTHIGVIIQFKAVRVLLLYFMFQAQNLKCSDS